MGSELPQEGFTIPPCSPLAAGSDLAAHELWDGAVEGVGGKLPGLRGPLRVNSTTTSTAGGHQSCPSPHGTEPPAILAVTPSLKALVGEDVTLECWVLGVPPPYVTWYKGETGWTWGANPLHAPGALHHPAGTSRVGTPRPTAGGTPRATQGADAGGFSGQVSRQ